MNKDHLIILESEVMSSPFEMGCLHEESTQQTFLDVCIIHRITCGQTLDLKSLFEDHVFKLFPDIICLAERPLIKIILPAPVCVHTLHNIAIKSIQQSNMVSTLMCKLFLGIISLGCRFSRPMEDTRNTQTGHNGQNLIGTEIVLGRGNEHF